MFVLCAFQSLKSGAGDQHKMFKYILEIWTPIPEERQTQTRKEYEITSTKEFYDPIEAWKYVIENNIKKYAIWKGECVVDNS